MYMRIDMNDQQQSTNQILFIPAALLSINSICERQFFKKFFFFYNKCYDKFLSRGMQLEISFSQYEIVGGYSDFQLILIHFLAAKSERSIYFFTNLIPRVWPACAEQTKARWQWNIKNVESIQNTVTHCRTTTYEEIFASGIVQYIVHTLPYFIGTVRSFWTEKDPSSLF